MPCKIHRYIHTWYAAWRELFELITSKHHNSNFTKRMFGRVYRYPRYLWWTYPTYRESGTSTEVVPNLPKCQVPVSSSYQTVPECSVGYRARCRTNTSTPGGVVVEGIPVSGVYLGERTELTYL